MSYLFIRYYLLDFQTKGKPVGGLKSDDKMTDIIFDSISR